MTAPSFAAIIHLTASLSGAKEVPPTTSKGKGTLSATYDTKTMKLSWRLPYSGLTGPAIAAHFHGPAMSGKNAPVLVPMMHADKSPITGSAILTKAQAKDLLHGDVYVNIHTKAHEPGEIRGQVMKAKK
ncbi:MAG: CHRD domain-containing protein [Methylovirgula sp.]